jgi:hypothetical protein
LSYSLRKNIVDLFRGGFFVLPLKLVILNLLIIITAFLTAKYVPDSFGESKYWFQRSGALVTLITIWVEVKLLDIISKRSIFNEIIDLKVTLSHFIPNFNVTIIDENKARKTNSDDIEFIRNQTKNRAKFFNGVVFINLVIGTIIWAYGDLIYINII